MFGILAGGLTRLAKYGFDVFSQSLEEKKELKSREQEHQFEIEKIRILKEQEISIEEYKSLTAKSEAEKSENETERAWIQEVAKLQTFQIPYLEYFQIQTETAWQRFFAFFVGIGNFLILLANLGIAGANVLKSLQKEVITLLIGYPIFDYIQQSGVDAAKEITGMIFLFETIVAYNFLDKNLKKKV